MNTNELGNLQQIFGAADIAATSRAAATAKTEKQALNQPTQSVSLGGANLGDRFSLSVLGGLTAQALTGSDVRSEKVAALQESMAAGTYRIPSSDVAGKLIDTLLK